MVSLILVSWNRREDLAVALTSVRMQDYPNIEIIVVDNGSTDGTEEMMRDEKKGPLVLYRATRNLGASVARNIGLRLAEGKFVAFMDSDAELLAPDTISILVRRMTDNLRLGAVAPAIYLDAERKEPWFLGGYYVRGNYCDQLRARKEWKNPEYLSTCFSVWDRDQVVHLGGFDPAMPYGFEDNDLSWRTLAEGRELAVEPSCAVRHHLSPASRIRAEREGWNHFYYDEQCRNRIQIKRLGFWGYLKEEAWQWTRQGRLQRHYIYLNAPLSRWQKLRLFVFPSLSTILCHPFRPRRTNWIEQASFDPTRAEKIAPDESK